MALACIFNDVGIGVNSYVGLVLRQQFDDNGNPIIRNGQQVNQWMLNIGGSWFDNYSSGIQVPFYVFYFGLLGGYLRYLYKALVKGGNETNQNNDKLGKSIPWFKNKMEILRETLREFSCEIPKGKAILFPLSTASCWLGTPEFNDISDKLSPNPKADADLKTCAISPQDLTQLEYIRI